MIVIDAPDTRYSYEVKGYHAKKRSACMHEKEKHSACMKKKKEAHARKRKGALDCNPSGYHDCHPLDDLLFLLRKNKRRSIPKLLPFA